MTSSNVKSLDPTRFFVFGSDPYLVAFFPWPAVASREGCFALARRSFFFRRLARFLTLSLPLLCPIGLTFAGFPSQSKLSDCDEPTWPVKPKYKGRTW